ncbi:MAG: Fe-S cluster assembly protein SufD [Dysgonamonadaceae bacterium]|jgi:Fe-S cluster assembly protein SufD|nr:Fe-S cluster assembly protein SufD [Dysgonamonadaceae bacterium]
MKQYIDFFEQYRDRINESCAPLLNACREKAFESFRQKGFPVCQAENYQYTDIAGLLKEDFGFYLSPSSQTVDPRRIFPCTIPNLNSFKHYVVNGWLYEEKAETDLPQGVFSGSLNTFAKQYPQVFSEYFNRQATETGDGLSAFNTLFVQDGYVLYVPKNTIAKKAFQLTNISGGANNSLTNRRILVIVESGAQAKLLVCDHTTDEQPVLAATQVVEIYAGENASFDFYELEESNRNAIRLTSNFVRQEASSTVILNNITLNNGITRNNYRIDLCGKQAELHLNGIAIVDKIQKVDNFTQINHIAPQCRCNELFKYILDDEATGAFSGKIVVAQDAQKTEACQTNRNLLGSCGCRMYSKPQLEIYADDVKCSHGMTTGQLDETALFYMRARGIPEEEAVLLLKFAFTNDVLQGIRIEGLRERLKLLIDKRFRGELLKCQGCI